VTVPNKHRDELPADRTSRPRDEHLHDDLLSDGSRFSPPETHGVPAL
jgi:hypothetical protein